MAAFAAALDLQLDRLEDLHATLEAHEKEDVLEMTWPKAKVELQRRRFTEQTPSSRRARQRVVTEPGARHGATPRAAGGAPGRIAGRLREGVARAPVGSRGFAARGFIRGRCSRVLGPTHRVGRLADDGLGARPLHNSAISHGLGLRPARVRGRLCGGGRSQDRVEINQCVGCTRQFFTKSFLSDGAAVLARSSGEEQASPRRRAGMEDAP